MPDKPLIMTITGGDDGQDLTLHPDAIEMIRGTEQDYVVYLRSGREIKFAGPGVGKQRFQDVWQASILGRPIEVQVAPRSSP